MGSTGVELLVLIPIAQRLIEALRSSYVVRYAPEGPGASALAKGRAVRAVLTNGSTGLSDAQMAQLCDLEIVCCFGAGYENVDLDAARRRRIAVTHAPGANDATVADHALALALALARGLVSLDRAVRDGRWQSSRDERPTLNGARAGVIGLGRVGAGIARRAAAFDMTVAYHTRTRRADVPWKHHANAVALARESDFLFIACPGGAPTHHLVGREVLDALGAEGYVINVARGSVLDTEALIGSLREQRIAGAGLDVIEGEPAVPAALLADERVLITPHLAGRSPAALRGQFEMLQTNLASHFAGRPLVTPVSA